MKNQSQQIAAAIKSQLTNQDLFKVWSWGADSWTTINDGLKFKVRGYKFKGIVQITLNNDTTVKIEFLKGNRVIKEYDGIVDFEMLDTIDNYVEYTKERYSKHISLEDLNSQYFSNKGVTFVEEWLIEKGIQIIKNDNECYVYEDDIIPIIKTITLKN